MTISFNNYAKKIGVRNIRESTFDWYQWCIFVDASEEQLNNIEHIIYNLDPSFPRPDRKIGKERRNKKFALKLEGWGSFGVQITVRLKDGSEEEYYYYLDLKKDGQRMEVLAPTNN